MAKDDKKEKGFLSKAWSVVSSPLVTIPAGIALGMVGMPLIADMGTWMQVFHDPTNVRALAFQRTMEPYTGWIPTMFGLTDDGGGFFHDLMSEFIGPELEAILVEQNAAQTSLMASSSGAAVGVGGFGDACEVLGNCEP